MESAYLPTNAVNDFPEVILCFSHLRWDFVYQRPQHLLTRMSRNSVVYYIEEPVFGSADAHYVFHKKDENVLVLVPHLPAMMNQDEETAALKLLLDELMQEMNNATTACWYYTPMALRFSRHLKTRLVIFDCMDELSAFKFAPQELKDLEQELLLKADVVFTGGASLYAAKKDRHDNIYLFPSSIEKEHFGSARNPVQCPADQQAIAHPRLGFFGVIDERFDTDLIDGIAQQRPDWNIVLIGPVVKIDPAILPKRDNIHYLGGKLYAELPAYLAGWDIALIPFALNDATRFISPTKTPEYLAAGIPVISTPLVDVIEPYGRLDLVEIAADATEFVAAGETLLESVDSRPEWLNRVDMFLKDISWNDTVDQMKMRIQEVIAQQAMLTPSAGNRDLTTI